MNAARLAWSPAPSSITPRARDWLQNRGSLTRLIQQRCSNFRVQPVSQSLATVCGDELAVMGLRHSELALVREVYLYCGNTPVVFAHSVVARKNLRGAWRGLSGLGNRSLFTPDSRISQIRRVGSFQPSQRRMLRVELLPLPRRA